MTARTLEAAGIATVVIGSALDILRTAGTPRVIFNDLPLGNPVGKPFDRDMQHRTVSAAFELLFSAEASGAVKTLPHQWSTRDAWRENFMAVRAEDAATLEALGRATQANRLENKAKGMFRR